MVGVGPVGTYDSGRFLSRAVTGGVLGGLVAGAWAAMLAGLSGLPWWSPLALYSTTLFGLRHPVVAAGLTGAVTAGLVWLALLGMAIGGVYGLLIGSAGPQRLRGGSAGVLGILVALLLFGVALSGRVSLLSPPFIADIPLWGRAVAFAWIGLTLGAFAAA